MLTLFSLRFKIVRFLCGDVFPTHPGNMALNKRILLVPPLKMEGIGGYSEFFTFSVETPQSIYLHYVSLNAQLPFGMGALGLPFNVKLLSVNSVLSAVIFSNPT